MIRNLLEKIDSAMIYLGVAFVFHSYSDSLLRGLLNNFFQSSSFPHCLHKKDMVFKDLFF